MRDPADILLITVESGPFQGTWLRQEIDMSSRAERPAERRCQEMIAGAQRVGLDYPIPVASPEQWGRLLLLAVAGAPGVKVIA